jgi:hypothetical protein
MHIDSFGLPCQSNGNCEDQLNRVGLIALACFFNYPEVEPTEFDALCDDSISDPMGLLVYEPGIYTRHSRSGPGDVTADQLIPVLAYHVAQGDKVNIGLMFTAMVKRFGFAQNVHKDNDPSTKTIPDIMVFRTLPLFARYTRWLYPVAVVVDIYLIIMVITLIISSSNSPDEVDDNNMVATLLTCLLVRPTFISKLAAKLYRRFRPTNYGVTNLGEKNTIMGSFIWYHRAETQGNPELAEMFRPLILKYFNQEII